MTVIQLALDRLTKEQCFELAEKTSPYIDWIEVGTGVIKEYGVEILREMKDRFPDKTIVADMKTCDAGKHEALQAFENGADVTTVMGFVADATIQDMLDVAKEKQKQVMIDLLGITDSSRIEVLRNLGADLLNIHIAIDLQKEVSWSGHHFEFVKTVPDARIAVSGGIKLENVSFLMQQKPAVLIVGSAITGAENPIAAAKALREGVDAFEANH